jgi:hypothetical protein
MSVMQALQEQILLCKRIALVYRSMDCFPERTVLGEKPEVCHHPGGSEIRGRFPKLGSVFKGVTFWRRFSMRTKKPVALDHIAHRLRDDAVLQNPPVLEKKHFLEILPSLSESSTH